MDQQKRRKREQEKQKRERLVQSKADPFPSQADSSSLHHPPHFPTLKRSDGQSDELTRMTKNILGPYDACQEAIFQSLNRNQQQQLLGTFEATPSTPLHVVGNPFDRQFARRSPEAPPTLSTKGAPSTTTSSLGQTHHNRHSVAEAPGTTTTTTSSSSRGEKGANAHPRSADRAGYQAKSGRSQPKVKQGGGHKKQSSRSQGGEGASGGEGAGSRPSNVLPVRKKEKSRVRPFKSAGSGGGGGGGAASPTTNQQGFTLPKKSSGSTGTSSQGAGDLFKVDSEQNSAVSARSLAEGAPSSHARMSTPPIPKKAPKLKKRHSHHLSLTTAALAPPLPPPTTTLTNNQSLGNGSPAPSLTMRKSKSVQSLVPLSSSHKHRKQSTSTAGTTGTHHTSTHHTSTPHTSTPHTSTHHTSHTSHTKKHGSVPSHTHPASHSDKTTSAAVVKTEPNSPSPHLLPSSSSSSGGVGRLSNTSSDHPTSGHRGAAVMDEKLAKRKKKKAKKERERLQQASTGHGGGEKISERLEIKQEPFEVDAQHSSRPSGDQTVTQELGGLSRVSGDQVSKVVVKEEKLNKQRPSNLTIDGSGDNAEMCPESPLDIKDVHSLLKELICNVSVPSPITPLSTPRTTTTPTLFTFPQATMTATTKLERITEAPPISPAHPMSESDSSGSSSSSDSSSDSSDCDEDNEQGQEKRGGRLPEAPLPMEEEDHAWEKVLPSMADSITPLKRTPPHLVANTPQLSSVLPASFHLPTISPLAPDTPSHTQHLPTSSSPNSASSFPSIGRFVLSTNVLPGGSSTHEFSDQTSSNVLSFPSSTATVGAASENSALPIYTQAASGNTTAVLEGNSESMGFPTVPFLPSSSSVSVLPGSTEVDDGASSSGSDGEGAESGSESDDESSDGEDEGGSSSSSSEEEEEEGERPTASPAHLGSTSATKPLVGGSSSVSSVPFFSAEDGFSFQEEGFFNDDDFLSRLQDRPDTLGEPAGQGASGPGSVSGSHFDQIDSAPTHPLAASSITQDAGVEPMQVALPPNQTERITAQPGSSGAASDSLRAHSQTHTDTALVEAPSTGDGHPGRLLTQQSLDSASRGGKKRKLERQSSVGASHAPLQPPARKTPRTSGPVSRRRDSSISSFSVSSDSSSDSSSSSDDDSDVEDSKPLPPTDTAGVSYSASAGPTLSLPPHATDHTAQNTPSSFTHTQTANVQPVNNRRDSTVVPLQIGGLEAGELEEDEMEGEWVESGGGVESLWVKISLQKVDFQREQKPKAKVEPYNVTAPSKPSRRRSTVDSSAHDDLSRIPGSHHEVDQDVRNMYGRRGDREEDHHGQYGRTDFHRDDGRRPHRGSGWERDSWSGGRHGTRLSRSHDRDHHRTRNWDEYGTYDDSRSRSRSHLPSRNMSAEECLREARKRKHDADRNRPPGIDRAKAYLESVAYFMRHGDAIEREGEAQCWDGAQTRSPFRLYMDTITLMKYCRSWANDCKQLVALCMRCVSVLYWKLFQLKQTSAANIQKDLQDFFIPSKSTQKSPYPGSLSPIPSPASVGSTASTGSGVGGASSLSSTQDPSPSSHVTVPKQVFSKAAEHLTITGYLHQSMDLWQQSNLIVEQYRDFFNALDRRSGCRITQFSPISVVADWLEVGARLVHYRQ